jgi:hypothetical protein
MIVSILNTSSFIFTSFAEPPRSVIGAIMRNRGSVLECVGRLCGNSFLNQKRENRKSEKVSCFRVAPVRHVVSFVLQQYYRYNNNTSRGKRSRDIDSVAKFTFHYQLIHAYGCFIYVW